MRILLMALGKRERALIALVLVDATLKAGAWAFLRSRSDPVHGGPIRLGYVENFSGFGFDQSRILSRYGIVMDDAFVACTLAVFLVLAMAIVLWHRMAVRPWIKTIAVVAVYCLAAAVALGLHDSMRLSLSQYLRGVLRALGPFAIGFTLYLTVTMPYYKALSLFLLAGTIGNCASILAPPFAVIDYFGIYRPAIGTYVYSNAADAYLLVAMLMIVLVPAYLLVRSRASAKSASRRASSP